MADLLQLTVLEYTATELKINVTNDSKALLDKSLTIEFFPPTYLVDERIKKAADDGLRDPMKSSLGNIVKGPTGWSFWAKAQSTTTTLAIEIYNDIEQATREEKTPAQVPVDAFFVISIPLKLQAARQDIQLGYKYTYKTDEFFGKLELKSDASGWQPDVTLSTTAPAPTAIVPGTSVKIKWNITDGVSATLYGPLTGGNSFLILSSSPDALYKIAEGSIEVRVVSAMTYLLLALVKGQGGQTVQVARTLTLDTLNSSKYLYVNMRPTKVLPYGPIWIDWAAWGVTPVEIDVGSRETHVMDLPGRIPEGSGFVRVNASASLAETFTIIAPSQAMKETKPITMTSWLPVTSQGVSGTPLGLAVVVSKLAVLTTEGLFIAEVGQTDSGSTTNLQFTRSTATAPKQWLALTGMDTRFVVLRRTSQDDLEVAPYKVDGSADTIPAVTLPADLRMLVAIRETVFDVVGFRGRAYVIVETVLPSGILRRAFSVGFGTSSAEYRSEPLLETLTGYKLVVFDNALYALSRKTGRMLRFNLSTSGTLEPPMQAASAVTRSQGPEQSMVRDGLIVPVGRVLAVLDPNAVPSLEEMAPYELRNVIMFTKTRLQAVDPQGNPQDIFYNPQKNYWGRCGHGLDVRPGAAAAFRSGGSPRLWVIQPDGKMHTLAVGVESLFVHDYMPGAIPWPLEACFKKRQITIVNTCGMQLRPLNSLPPAPIERGATAKFDIDFNEADAPVQLRFLLERAKGVKHYYVLEMSFSGPNLSQTKYAIQRFEVDGQGTMSMAEIPGSAWEQSTDSGLHPTTPARLLEGVLLSMANSTNYPLFQQAPEASDPTPKPYNGDRLGITYNTPTFFVYGEGAGELHVNVDFSLPTGIEISPSSAKQSKLVRINTDRSLALYPEFLTNPTETNYQLKIDYRRKVLDGVYVGDGVATKDGTSIFLPVALPRDQSQVQVWKINSDNLSHVASGNLSSGGGLFAPPNSIALSNEYVFAMIDNDIHIMNHSLQKRGQANVNNFYTFVGDVDVHFDGPDCFLLGMKQDRPIDTSKPIWFHYILGVAIMAKDPSGNLVLYTIRDTSLDSVRGIAPKNPIRGAPTWVSSATFSPMAISPIPLSMNMRKVAVCIEGGLFVVEPNPIRIVPVPSAGREEDVIFSRDGRTVYCLHTRTDNQGLVLSRINIENSQVHSLSLPRGEGPFDLTGGQQIAPPFPNKNQRAASVVCTAEETWFFVSHGKSIFKIQNGPAMAYRETYTTELPCRVFHVGKTNPTVGNVLYAIGASYRGDGKKGSGVTHLYKIRTHEK